MIASVDELVEQVRSRIHDDIQRLHGTMQLWGIDHWVPLGDLFVDINILEELSSSRRSELDDLWQDYSQNPSYRSLDRIGLGKQQKRISSLEVLKKNKNLMVVGKPGSGKTTFLQHVVMECNGGNIQADRIPCLIKLRDFVEDGREFVDGGYKSIYLLKPYLEKCWQLSDKDAETLLKQGRLLLLLDGLDEVIGDDGDNITKEIRKFARSYPQVQMIITCRIGNEESRIERFDYVEVADFNEPQVRLFTKNWFETVSKDSSDALSQKFLDSLFLEENRQIRELAITPILLSLTCEVFFKTKKFYSKRSKLYEESLAILLDKWKWDKSRKIARDEIYHNLSLTRKLELLSYLAVKKFEQTQYVLFEQEELERNIADFLEIELRDSQAVLKAIEVQHGLLIERAQKIWSFSHLTFQEYLVSKYYCKDKSWDKLGSFIIKNEWREIFFLIIESQENSNNFLEFINKKVIDLQLENSKIEEILRWLFEKSNLAFVENQSIRNMILPRDANIKIDQNNLNWETDKAQYITEFRLFYFDLFNAYSLSRSLVSDCNILSHLHFYKDLTEEKTIPYILILDHRLYWLSAVIPHSLQFLIWKDFDVNIQRFSEISRDFSMFAKLGLYFNEIHEKFLVFWHQIFLLNKEIYFFSQGNDIDFGSVLNVWNNWFKKYDNKLLLQELKIVMRNERNIACEWSINSNEEELLKQYYQANKLLIECISIAQKNNYIGSVSIDNIKENLLLPIAEIEKYKRDKLE